VAGAPLLCALALMSGCASADFSIRTLPAETPAADNAAAIKRGQELQAARAAMTTPAEGHGATEPAGIGPPLTPAEVPSLQTYDPWERMNRFTYRFNARLDESFVLPVTDQYRRLPSPLRTGAHNFFANLREIMSTLNYVAQLRPAPGVRSLGRFVINSTLGIGGLFDVAKAMKIPSAPTGFGATLARWGMHPGPYFVIPLLGPNTVRDGVGWGVDFSTGYIINVANLYQGTIGWYLLPVGLLDQRASVNYRYYGTGSPFEYDNIRFLYVRKTLIEDDAVRMWHRRGSADAQTPAGK